MYVIKNYCIINYIHTNCIIYGGGWCVVLCFVVVLSGRGSLKFGSLVIEFKEGSSDISFCRRWVGRRKKKDQI